MATFSRVRLEAGKESRPAMLRAASLHTSSREQAGKESYPVLLSNGNRLEHGDCGGGRHLAVWEDPYLPRSPHAAPQISL